MAKRKYKTGDPLLLPGYKKFITGRHGRNKVGVGLTEQTIFSY